MGFVANWITEWYAYHPAVRDALGLKAGERIAGFVYIGHPVEPLVDRPRPAFEDIARFFTLSLACARRRPRSKTSRGARLPAPPALLAQACARRWR